MTALQDEFEIATRGPGLIEFTERAAGFAARARGPALLTLFVRHTSCGLLIQENADPDVVTDLEGFLARLVPRADAPAMDWLRHRLEGPDDMPAHIKAALVPVSLQIPVTDGRLALGRWQGIYLWEFRDRPQRRQVAAHLSG